MAKKQLHPSVQQFKEYVRAHPELIKQVRSGRNTWQELYEEWYLLGDDTPNVDDIGEGHEEASESSKSSHSSTKEESTKRDWMSSILGAVKNMDPNQLQHHIASFSSALGAIQGVIASLQGGGGSEQPPPKKDVSPPSHPFQFRQD